MVKCMRCAVKSVPCEECAKNCEGLVPLLPQGHVAEFDAVLGRNKLIMKLSSLAARDLVMLAGSCCRAEVHPLPDFLTKVFTDSQPCVYTLISQSCSPGGEQQQGFSQYAFCSS